MLDRQDLSNLSKKIAAHIVGSGLSLRSDSNDALVALTCEETTPDSRWSDVNASFSLDKDGHWNTDAEIRVHGEPNFDRETDEDGAVTTKMAISVTLRFNGSVDMIADPTLLARIDLISHAARLAQDLQKEYAGAVAYRVRTAEEERVRLAKEQAEDKRRKVQRMAEYPSKGLRAGGNPRTVSRELFTGCEDGQYEVSYDEGRRNCRVTLRAGSATIRRLA